MKENMYADYEPKISYRVQTGVRYTCDACGKIIADSTRKSSEYQGSFLYIGVKISKGDGIFASACACDKNCAAKLREQWYESLQDAIAKLKPIDKYAYKEVIKSVSEKDINEGYYNMQKDLVKTKISPPDWEELKANSQSDVSLEEKKKLSSFIWNNL